MLVFQSKFWALAVRGECPSQSFLKESEKTFVHKSFLRSLFIFFAVLFLPSLLAQEVKSIASSGTLLSSLMEETRTAIAARKIPEALESYDKLFQLSFKENKDLLESLCLKIFEQSLDTQNSELKKNLLTLLVDPLNIPLARLLFKALQDSNSAVRAQALILLSKFNDPAIYPDLSASLASKDLQTVESALILIANIKEKTFLSQVQKLLEHPDPRIQSQAILTMTQLNPDEAVFKTLKKMITHPSDRVRSSVLDAFTPLEEETLELQPLLKDQSIRVRRSLLAWAEKHPSKVGDSVIRRELAEKDTPLFSETCRAALQSDSLIRRIDWNKIKHSDSAELREMALRALFKNGDFFLEEETVFYFLSDSLAKIRELAALTILESQDPGVPALLHKLLNSQNNKAKQSLITTLIHSQKNPFSSQDMENLLTSQHAQTQVLSIPLLDRIESFRQKKILQQILSSNKVNVRSALFSFFKSQKKAAWFQSFYSEGLNDPAIQVQIETLSGVHLLEDESLQQKILEKYKISPFAALRTVAVREAAHFSKETRHSWIEFALKDKMASVRKSALELTQTLEDPVFVLQTFSDALFDPDEGVRNYVVESFQKIGTPEKESASDFIAEKPLKPVSSPQTKSSLLSWMKQSSTHFNPKQKLSLKEEPVTASLPKESRSQDVTGKLRQLLTSTNNQVSTFAEDCLLQIGDENEISKLKNRLTQSTKLERKKITEKLGILSDPSLAPLLRAQLKEETEEDMKIQLAVALWKISHSLVSE